MLSPMCVKSTSRQQVNNFNHTQLLCEHIVVRSFCPIFFCYILFFPYFCSGSTFYQQCSSADLAFFTYLFSSLNSTTLPRHCPHHITATVHTLGHTTLSHHYCRGCTHVLFKVWLDLSWNFLKWSAALSPKWSSMINKKSMMSPKIRPKRKQRQTTNPDASINGKHSTTEIFV